MCTNILNQDYSPQPVKIEEPLLIPCKKVLKNRWRPTETEINTLKSYFEKNPYPNKQEKKQIVNYLSQNLSSQVEINQLNRWFQNQRERTLNSSTKSLGKGPYKKFTEDQVSFLNESFSNSSYPKLEEMKAMAKRLNVKLNKVENWFKHNRRALVKEGCFKLKTKKYFSEYEIRYLEGEFQKETHPMTKKIKEMSERLRCEKLQIKNWFSNRRKKVRLMGGKANTESLEIKLQAGKCHYRSKIAPISDNGNLESDKSNISTGKSVKMENLDVSEDYAPNQQFNLPNDRNKICINHPLLEAQNSLLTSNNIQDVCKSEEPSSSQILQQHQQYTISMVSQKNMFGPVFQVFMRPLIGQNLPIYTVGDNLFEKIQSTILPSAFESFKLNECSFVNPINLNFIPVKNFPTNLSQNNMMVPTNVTVPGSFAVMLAPKHQITYPKHIPVSYYNRNYDPNNTSYIRTCSNIR